MMTTYNVSFRFVDCDMYMYYAGNGIGHYKVDLANDARIAAPSTDIEHVKDEGSDGLEGAMAEDLPLHAPMTNDGDIHSAGEGTKHEVDEDEEDKGKEDEDKDSDVEEGEDEDEGEEEEVDDSESEDNFGAKGGEGGFVDLEDEEGYTLL